MDKKFSTRFLFARQGLNAVRVLQVKSLKITVKDANGIIVKSEALKEEYRGKVAQLTRQLSETQVIHGMSCCGLTLAHYLPARMQLLAP